MDDLGLMYYYLYLWRILIEEAHRLAKLGACSCMDIWVRINNGFQQKFTKLVFVK